MCPESQVGDFVEINKNFLRIKLIPNMSIAVLLAVSDTAQLFPSKRPTPPEKNVDAAKCIECDENKIKDWANCLEHSAVNPEVKSRGQSIN